MNADANTHRKTMKPLATPRELDIAITGRCNLACAYCGYADPMTGASDISTKAWLGLFDEMAECKVLNVTFTGGEPFLRDDLLDLVDAIVRRKMRFALLSNATLVTEDKVKRLRDTGRLSHIQVSVDSTTPAVHDSLRGSGSYQATEKGLRTIVASGVRTLARITLTPRNLPTLRSSLETLLDLGATEAHIHEVIPLSSGRRNYGELRLTHAQLLEAWHVIADFNAEHPRFVSGQIPQLPDKIRTAAEAFEKQAPLSDVHGLLTGCGNGHSHIDVLHDGSFVPCQLAPDIRLGKVGEDKLIDIWNSSQALHEWRMRWGTPLEEYESCCGCSYTQVCNGGCPALAYADTGDFRIPSTRWCYRTLIEDGRYLPDLTIRDADAQVNRRDESIDPG